MNGHGYVVAFDQSQLFDSARKLTIRAFDRMGIAREERMSRRRAARAPRDVI